MKQLKAITDQLDVARRLLTQQRLDVVEALAMLNALPPNIRNDLSSSRREMRSQRWR